MEMKDFERRGNGVTYIYKCNIAPLSFNFRQKDGRTDFQIFGYGYGVCKHIKTEYLERVDSIEECNSKLKDYMEKLELILEVTENPDYTKFIKSLKNIQDSPNRKDRLKIKSSDGVIEMFVEYNHRYGYFAMVRDVSLEDHEIKDGQLRPAFATEKEAECAIQEAMNEYELKGFYTRELSRTPRLAFEHEADERVLKAVKEVMKPYIWTVVGDKVYLTDEQLLKIMKMIEFDII